MSIIIQSLTGTGPNTVIPAPSIPTQAPLTVQLDAPLVDPNTPAPGGAARMPGVEGALMFSNRGNGDPTQMDPERLRAALEANGGSHLVRFLPPVTGVGTAIRAAISRVTASLRTAKMEWREVQEKDASGNRVILLLAITADADAQTLDARKLGAVLIDATGAAYGVVNNPIMQPAVDAFIAQYLKEKGIMGSAQLWQTAQSIAFSSNESFSCNSGQMFVTGASEENLILFDRALHSLNSHYRLRHLPFHPATGAEAIRDGALFSMMEEMKALRGIWDARKTKADAGKKDVRLNGVLSTVEGITNMMARYKLMGKILAAESTEFQTAFDTLKAEALEAITNRK